VLRLAKQYLSRSAANLFGWTTNRKIVVFESDDWGSVRMPSREAYDHLLTKGIRVDRCPYNRFDCLEHTDDLKHLFEVLSAVKDKHGRHPVITANTNPANPDFDLIRKGNLEQYHYHNFVDSYKLYQGDSATLNTIKEGIGSGVYFPQYHGREHVNVHLWMELLRNKANGHIREAFDRNVFGLSFATSPEIKVPYLATFIYRNPDELGYVKSSIADGAAIFRSVFGFTSQSIIAPLYAWTGELEEFFPTAGITYVQGSPVRKEYNHRSGTWVKKRRFFSGASNKPVALVRNARFEPSLVANVDETDYCLRDISTAFALNKPAIISVHRVNFIGQLDTRNRDTNLRSLQKLLQSITKKWPDTEFMTSVDLGLIMNTHVKE
jgi:hypothetical protein